MSMTENLLQKLEEKTMSVLGEVEELRKEVQHLQHENAALRNEKENNTRKLHDLISLLDTVAVNEAPVIYNANLSAVKPVLVQG